MMRNNENNCMYICFSLQLSTLKIFAISYIYDICITRLTSDGMMLQGIEYIV